MRVVLPLWLILLLVPAVATGNSESARLRAAAYDLAYNLDYDEATSTMEAAVRADPGDPAAERGLAVIPWLLISFSRGAVTVDDYLGGLSRSRVVLRAPPPDLAMRFAEHANRSRQLAEALANANDRDPEALYQLGATIGLQASYVATVEGRVLGAFRAARRAYELHERVLELDPSRADAGLVIGTYRYIVGSMSMPLRLLAYVVGFDGDRARGLRLIEQAAAAHTEAQAEARFALVLLYNREGRYDDALRVLGELERAFPRNRILWLEEGATALRAGRAGDAERILATARTRFASDPRPRMFGEEALWTLKHGTALVALDRLAEAEQELRAALALQARTWVLGRVHAELGKIADLRNNRATARVEFQEAVRLAGQDNDPAGAKAARQWVKHRFRR